jgi:hypothetical protein
MFTSLGIPMLWEGQEFSAPRGWTDGGHRLSYRPVEWYLYPTPRGQSHFAWYKTLIRQRKRNPALYDGILRRLWRYDAQKTLVWGFEDTTTTARFVCVANFTNVDQTVNNIPWIGSGTFYNIVDQSTLTVSGGVVPSMMVPAYTARCYSSIPDSILNDVRQTAEQVPSRFDLLQNYPNPFNPSTRIRFSIPSKNGRGGEWEKVVLEVYDVLGREVRTLVNEDLPPGSYEVTWDATGMPSGVYLYKLTAGSFTQTRKMILMR